MGKAIFHAGIQQAGLTLQPQRQTNAGPHVQELLARMAGPLQSPTRSPRARGWQFGTKERARVIRSKLMGREVRTGSPHTVGSETTSIHRSGDPLKLRWSRCHSHPHKSHSLAAHRLSPRIAEKVTELSGLGLSIQEVEPGDQGNDIHARVAFPFSSRFCLTTRGNAVTFMIVPLLVFGDWATPRAGGGTFHFRPPQVVALSVWSADSSCMGSLQLAGSRGRADFSGSTVKTQHFEIEGVMTWMHSL